MRTRASFYSILYRCHQVLGSSIHIYTLSMLVGARPAANLVDHVPGYAEEGHVEDRDQHAEQGADAGKEQLRRAPPVPRRERQVASSSSCFLGTVGGRLSGLV